MPPRFADRARRDQVRALSSKYGELAERLDDRPRAGAPPDDRAGPLGVLERLFGGSEQVDGKEAVTALGPDALEALEAVGLLAEADGRLRSTVRLDGIDGLLVASDRAERHLARASDFVVGPFGVTRRLASLILPGRRRSVLDLGCGSGALGLVASRDAERVVCTDENPRAVAFARFNAELNGAHHVECRAGDLFEPVRGERFDLILCNPPYVISPDATFDYRDGGGTICRRIVRGAPEHLEDGGFLQMSVEWPERAGRDWRSEVGEWVQGIDCDAWLLRTYSLPPSAYAELWLGQEWANQTVPAEVRARWERHLDDAGVASVGGGHLVLRRPASTKPIRTLRVGPPVGRGSLGLSLARWIAAQTALASVPHDGAMLDRVYRTAPGLERIERAGPTGAGWARSRSELRLREGLRFAARLDPVGEAIVGFLDGERTARQAVERFAGDHGVPADPFLRGWPAALRRLLELGLLLPVPNGPGTPPRGPEPDGTEA